jgi:hypothetical protein
MKDELRRIRKKRLLITLRYCPIILLKRRSLSCEFNVQSLEKHAVL